MTRMMFGPILLLAASVSPIAPASSPAPRPVASYRATATATASIRIISGVRFGPGQISGAAGADRRKAQLADADGLIRPAELLEFQ